MAEKQLKKPSHTFSMQEAFAFGWQTTLKKFWLFLGILVTIWATYLIPLFIAASETINSNNQNSFPVVGFLLLLIAGIALVGMYMGVLKIMLDLYDHKKAKYRDLFAFFRFGTLGRYILAWLLYYVMVEVGLILLIIPGVYLATKYAMFPYVFVDKKLGVIASFKASSELTRGAKWKLIGYGVIAYVLMLVGVFTFGLGLLLAIPVTYLASASIYRQLESK